MPLRPPPPREATGDEYEVGIEKLGAPPASTTTYSSASLFRTGPNLDKSTYYFLPDLKVLLIFFYSSSESHVESVPFKSTLLQLQEQLRR